MSAAKLTPPRVDLVGRLDAKSAFSQINLTLLELLEASGRWTVGHRSGPSAKSTASPPDLTIWQDWEDDFASAQTPTTGKLAAIRPWDFGPYPPTWAEKIRRDCDELWIHSSWTRQLALRSGVPSEQIRVIPLGVDCDRFCPEGDPMALPSQCRSFRFLFAGATVRRKGFDIAVDAFLEAFDPGEDVCLVVKDRTDGVFYSGQQGVDARLRLEPYVEAGNVAFVHEHLPIDDLAALYRACDLLVLPYRAEGFALTAAEAMACGTPCLVPRFGACLDYCDDDNALFVSPRRICLPVAREIAYNTLGFTAKVDEVDFCEVPVEVLTRRMREIFEHGKQDLRARGVLAAETIRTRFSLGSMARNLDEAIDSLVSGRARRGRGQVETLR